MREIPSFSSVSRPDTGGAPISLDTCFVQFTLSFPIINRRQHTVVCVLAIWVIEYLDIIEHILPCCVTCELCPPPDPVAFQQPEEAFSHCVVIAISTLAHTGAQIVYAKKR